MTQWYYADASGQRQGPFSAEELASHVRHARLGAASLVWREGLQDWQPLRTVAAELDLQLDAIDAPAADVAVPAPDAPYTPPSADLASFQPVVAGHVVQAGLWKRFAASCIDSMVTTIISYALMIPLMLIGVGVMGAGGQDGDVLPLPAFFLGKIFSQRQTRMLLHALPPRFFIWGSLCRRGQSGAARENAGAALY